MTGIRIAQGLLKADDFIAFLGGTMNASTPDWSWALVPLAFFGGLAMNLTPCVLPMVPVNLAIIGASARRGAAYGLGIALAYGVLGLAAAVGGLAFGSIQGNPWFNLVVALVFVVLAMALSGVFFIDFAKFRPHLTSRGGLGFAFGMGGLSAVLAGACVAPVLISILLVTASAVAKGNWYAVVLPFLVGLGMGAPWPLIGAGLKILPRPGKWMRHVNRLMAVIILGFAVWYGHLAWQGFSRRTTAEEGSATPATFSAALAKARRPVLVDCWATWCKNCAAMDRVLAEPKVQAALKPFTVIRLQAEDMDELTAIPGFESIRGLPAMVVIE